MTYDHYIIGETITDADPRVADVIINGASCFVVLSDLTEAPLFAEWLMSGRKVIAEADV